MLEALSANVPVATEDTPGPSAMKLIEDSEEDYEFARKNLKKLLADANKAIDLMMNLAQGCEHPRAFEVLGNLMRNASDINDQLMTLQKDRRRLSGSQLDATQRPGGEVDNSKTHNTLFVGSVTQLQKFLKNQTDTENGVIDVEAEYEDDDS